MLEVKYADDIEVKVIVAHPNSYPHFPAASIHTAILWNWKGTVLVSHQFIVTIEEVHPVWAAWGEVAFRFLLELRSSFLESNWVNIVHNCTHNVPLNISSWTCLRFLCKALYPRSLPGPYFSCLKTIAISWSSTLRSVYRTLKYSSLLSRDRRLQAYWSKSLDKKSKISQCLRFSFTYQANESFQMSAVTILKTDMLKGNLVYGSNGPCAFFFAMAAMSRACFFFHFCFFFHYNFFSNQ